MYLYFCFEIIMLATMLIDILINNSLVYSSDPNNGTDLEFASNSKNESTQIHGITTNDNSSEVQKDGVSEVFLKKRQWPEKENIKQHDEYKDLRLLQQNFIQKVLEANIPTKILSEKAVKEYLVFIYVYAPYLKYKHEPVNTILMKHGFSLTSLDSCYNMFKKIIPYDYAMYEGIVSLIWHVEQMVRTFYGEFGEKSLEEKFSEWKNAKNSEKKYPRSNGISILCLNAQEHNHIMISCFSNIFTGIILDKKDDQVHSKCNPKTKETVVENSYKSVLETSKPTDMPISLIEMIINKWIKNRFKNPTPQNSIFQGYVQKFIIKMQEKEKVNNKRTKKPSISETNSSRISWYRTVNFFTTSPPSDDFTLKAFTNELLVHLELVECIYFTNPTYWKNKKSWNDLLCSNNLTDETEIFEILQNNSKKIYGNKLMHLWGSKNTFNGLIDSREAPLDETISEIVLTFCPYAKEKFLNMSSDSSYEMDDICREEGNLLKKTQTCFGPGANLPDSFTDTPIPMKKITQFVDEMFRLKCMGKDYEERESISEIKYYVRAKKQEAGEIPSLGKESNDIKNTISAKNDDLMNKKTENPIEPGPKVVHMSSFALYFCLLNWYKWKYAEHVKIFSETCDLSWWEIFIDRYYLLQQLKKYTIKDIFTKSEDKRYISFSKLQKYLRNYDGTGLILPFALTYLKSLYELWEKDNKFFKEDFIPFIRIRSDKLTEEAVVVIDMIQGVEAQIEAKSNGEAVSEDFEDRKSAS